MKDSAILFVAMTKFTVDPRSSLESVQTLIHAFRPQRVALDANPATIYGTTAKRLNEQVRWNRERFPAELLH
ncbi:MAG: ORF6N domain-containing protein [Deltaproteobacteria bacterium]|nr:ORF6N domain-containing protein [Deltaproteobacteria bacterium]